MKISEILVAKNITATVTPTPENPNMSNSDNMSHYHCQFDGFSTYYSIGSNIIDAFMRKGFKYRDVIIDRAAALRWLKGDRDIQAKKAYDVCFKKAVKTYCPSSEDVIGCLAGDASGYDCALNFEDWAVKYGYDTDSRKAEKTYHIVAEQSKALRHLLGEHYETALEAAADM